MKIAMSFVKATVAGGFFVVVPVVLVVLILAEIFDLVTVIAEPIADMVPIEGLTAPAERALIATVLIVAVCFLTGLAMRVELGVRLGRWIEGLILKRIPGYQLIRGLSRRVAGDDRAAGFAPAVITTALQTRVFALVIEELEDSDVVVFVPATPTPAVGMIHIVRRDQVRKLDVPLMAVVNCLAEFGLDAGKLLPPPEREPTAT